MAQYFRNFVNDVIGQLPTGWEQDIQGSGAYTVVDLGGTLGKALRYGDGTNLGERYCYWTGNDSPGSFLDGDILVKIRSGSLGGGNDVSTAIGRVPNPPRLTTTNQMVVAAIPEPSRFRINRLMGYSQFANVANTFAATTNYYVRFNYNGGLLKSRIWEEGTGEPSTWTIEVEVTSGLNFNPGYVGMQVYSGNDKYWFWYSVSTDPTIPANNPDLVGAIPIPVNLGVTNIQNTSVRLTWDQGV